MNELTVVCEIGSNWRLPDMSDSYLLAIKAIHEAAEVGANVVKFQVWHPDRFYSKERAPKQYEHVKKYQLPLEWIPALSTMARDEGLEFWLSVFDIESMLAIAKYCSVIKVASGDLTNKPLASAIARECEYYHIGMAISTGASTRDEVKATLGWLEPYRLPNLILMECCSSYPAQPLEYNLSSIIYFRSLVHHLGLSDHTITQHATVGMIAVGAGYTYFEKHFAPNGTSTDSPDYGVSLGKEAFGNYVKELKDACDIMGDFTKQPRISELGERVWARRGKDGLRPVEGATS